MKRTLKKVFVFAVVIIANFILLVNTVQAVEKGEEITIYSKGYFNRIIQKSGVAIKTTHAVYQENGRLQSEENAIEIDNITQYILESNNINYFIFTNNDLKNIMNVIKGYMNKKI